MTSLRAPRCAAANRTSSETIADHTCGPDNCLRVYNPDQADSYGDRVGDDCKPKPVGGAVVPVNRLELLAPLLGVAFAQAGRLAVRWVTIARRREGG